MPNDASHNTALLVNTAKRFLRGMGFKLNSVANLVRDNRPLPRFEDSNLGRYYIDSTGGRHWTGNNIIYEYKDGIDGLTHWFTPEEIEARIEYTKPVALKVEESDNVPCDPETVPGGVVSYNVSHTSTTVPDWGDAYEEQESVRREAEAFIAANPDYVRCMPNFETLTNWMVARHLAPTRTNFQSAYDQLKFDGKMVLNNPATITSAYYDRRAAANLRASRPRRYSPQEVAAVRAATPYHPSTRTGIGQIINVNTERLALAAFEVTELKDISDINLYTSKTKQPLAVKEPGNRRFQFEQEER